MSHQLPDSALLLWQSLNDVRFYQETRLAAIPGKGCGLVAGEQGVNSSSTSEAHGGLLRVPRELVLNAEAVDAYAKQQGHFRELLDAVGRRSTRGDILLFLLVHLVVGQGQGQRVPGREVPSVPWTDYIKFLPDNVPLPTLWTDAERRLLRGTSLENAVEAKRLALEHEFDEIRHASSDLFFWQAVLWEQPSPPQLRHWFLVDAWYRSRCLDLPSSGPSMVPCIDMVNHSATPNAYYDEVQFIAGTACEAVLLLLRPGQDVAASDEITISYSGGGCGVSSSSSSLSSSKDVKSASEMLFSYGFVDPYAVRHHLVLPLRPLPDDPLAKAKLHVSGGPAQRLEVERLGGSAGAADNEGEGQDQDQDPAVRWTCPFAYLMCVNEEDGLDFRLQQETDGSTQLRMFWQDVDVTDSAQDFPSLVSTHALAPVFQLRVVTVVQEILEAQLERMQAADQDDTDDDDDDDDDDDEAGEDDKADDDAASDDSIRSEVATQSAILRDIESRILSSALEALEAERSDLLSNATVVAYLGSMEVAQSTLAHDQAPNQGQHDEAMAEDADDFS